MTQTYDWRRLVPTDHWRTLDLGEKRQRPKKGRLHAESPQIPVYADRSNWCTDTP